MIAIQFLMTITSSTGVHRAELANEKDITVLETLQKLENQEKKDIITKIMTPERNDFKPGVLVLAGSKDKLKPAKWDTLLEDGHHLKITTIVGGG